MKYMQYIGILLGALYGIGFRLLCEKSSINGVYDYYNIYSITFIWIVPIIVGIIPILFAREAILKSPYKQFLFPILSVLLFFLFALSSGLEDWLCILIIAFPFLLIAGIVGLLVSRFIDKKNSNTIYSILFIPLFLNPLETYIPNKNESYTVNSEIIINANDQTIWDHLIVVPEIKKEEFPNSFFNTIGVPRPVKSELKTINNIEYRIGYFTDGLELYETISAIDTLKFVNFKIHIEESNLRDTPTDKHLLQSDYFLFNNISYKVEKVNHLQSKVILNCDYSIDSKMNFYANFWAEKIIKDFEESLLLVLKNKIEKGCSQK